MYTAKNVVTVVLPPAPRRYRPQRTCKDRCRRPYPHLDCRRRPACCVDDLRARGRAGIPWTWNPGT